MATVNQPTFAPTNKLTAVILAGAAYEFLQPAVARAVDGMADLLGIGWSVGPNGDTLLQLAVMALFGYFVKDRPNV